MQSIEISAEHLRAIIREELSTKSIPYQEADDILDIKSAAKFLNVSVRTVYQMCWRNQIPYCKRTGRSYFLKPQLEKWLEDGQRNAIAEIRMKLK